jgi:hypothetical protein
MPVKIPVTLPAGADVEKVDALNSLAETDAAVSRRGR